LEQFIVFSCGGFVRQDFQEETGLLESRCGSLKHQLLNSHPLQWKTYVVHIMQLR